MGTVALKEVDLTKIYGLDSGPVTKQQTAYNFLKEAIVSGRYMPEKPLIEREICETLDISRTPVREALRRLHTEGLVENYPGRGMFVVGATIEKSTQVHELKEAIEAMAARLCCDRITSQELHRLRDCIELHESAIASRESRNVIDSDMMFHVILLEGAHSAMLEEQGKALTWQARRYAQLVAFDIGSSQNFADEHRAIYAAIESRDADSADHGVRVHMDTVKRFQKERWAMLFGDN